MHCASCLHQGHRHGRVTYDQQMLGAAIVHPDVREVMPVMPEPMVQHDGTSKNAGERHAATRCMTTWRKDHPHLKGIVPEDRLSANAPHIETLQDHDLHDILGVKAGDHAVLFQQVQAAEHAGRVTHDERHHRAAGLVQRFRFVNDGPLHASNADVQVNCLESWERGDDTVQHVSWVTDVRVNKRHVVHRMRGGRARWTIEHETFHTLKTQGDHFEQNYGHGMQHLAVMCALLMMLAFLADQVQPLCCALLQAVWAQLGSTRLLWERLRALFYDDALESMRQRLEALFDGLKTPTPILMADSSSVLQ
jgi:hypothetical protein